MARKTESLAFVLLPILAACPADDIVTDSDDVGDTDTSDGDSTTDDETTDDETTVAESTDDDVTTSDSTSDDGMPRPWHASCLDQPP